MTPQKKTNIILAGAAVILALCVLVCWAAFKPRALDEVKEITLTVYHTDESVNDFTIRTTARTLAEALLAEEIIEGVETEDGLFVFSVDGETADGTNSRYWVSLVNSEENDTPADELSIADGDHFTYYTIVE